MTSTVLEHASTFSERHKALSEWIKTYLHCDNSATRQVAKTINKNRTFIENAWHYHKSNGPTEGLNKKIKDIKRLAFGAHDFDNFRKRVLLACSGNDFARSTYTIFSEKHNLHESNKKGGSHE